MGGNKLLRFCLDVVAFMRPTSENFGELIRQGEKMALLVAQDAVEFSLKMAVGPDWVPLRWET